ncbi:hypothetical protein B0T10DRAFT_500316 [Thelonectria olida]|uniref:Uncharacterized protein n=1 Tax=Thelonectria olida TaxID=1576542 RepID=A0A9P9AF34_9HYPO|nr:hypothetical protein B0T10DRAFT_500316 [Thelonectria olida]
MLSSQSPSTPNFPAWSMAAKPQPSDLTMQFLQQPGVLSNTDLVYQGLVESEFDTINPPTLSCLNPEVIMGMSDPMVDCFAAVVRADHRIALRDSLSTGCKKLV